MADTELSDWKDLIDSPGWARLLEHARQTWTGPTILGLVEQMADKPADSEALAKLRQMIAAKRAVERLLQIPAEAIARIERNEPNAAPLGRRGAL